MTHSVDGPAVTREIAQRMKDLRRKRDLDQAELAERMTGLGVPWDRSIVANLESGRRRSVAVDEVYALALALNVAPVHLLVPVDDGDQPYQVTATVTAERFRVRAWIRGHALLEKFPRAGASREFFSEQPEEDIEWGRLTDTALGKGRGQE
jgi:transcriptional regulator with XRE-family HTH domain